eukprot:gnl/TRDRNA2_/TRDRNA2_17586_c0_seq1.p1 gnl/TRDRNA2_/TRDRNA2_17586_c0~~gnl/TRDRNA2_/TRDRNA2_17586_c0_seq1.p1  ORF type:complete len:117 (+),score=33.82 gnl/TRDRNA2_/TRDRNA2_17586_c0_seq1:1-351(+)
MAKRHSHAMDWGKDVVQFAQNAFANDEEDADDKRPKYGYQAPPVLPVPVPLPEVREKAADAGPVWKELLPQVREKPPEQQQAKRLPKKTKKQMPRTKAEKPAMDEETVANKILGDG